MNRLYTFSAASKCWKQLRFPVVYSVSGRAANSSSAAEHSLPTFEDGKSSLDSEPKQNKQSNNPYRNLYPWKDEVQLAKLLAANIVFVDRGLIAINKPFGLGMYAADNQALLHSAQQKQQGSLTSELFGSPRYCLAEVLDYLSQLLNVNQLSIVKCKCWKNKIVLQITS